MSYNPLLRGNVLEALANEAGDNIENNSGLTIAKATPVRIDTDGNMRSINVSVEAEALAVAGVARENIISGNSGPVLSSGRVEDIVTTANNGDVLYVAKTGGLTNIKPSIGVGGFVSGDFVIRIGVLYKNEDDPLKQDLLLNISVVGQL